MRSAGYAREDGDWYDPDGESVWFRLRTPMWPQWKASAELLDQALSEFGFDVDFSQVPAPRLVSDVDTHNFDVLLWPSDGNPHTLYDVTQTGATALGYGVTDPATERSVTGKAGRGDGPGGGRRRRADGKPRRPVAPARRPVRPRDDGRRGGHVRPVVEPRAADIHVATGVSGTWGIRAISRGPTTPTGSAGRRTSRRSAR